MSTDSARPAKLSANEGIKTASNFLRGTLAQGVADPLSATISADDGQLIKFHGMYAQDDRDLRNERRKQRLDKAHSFMLRVRLPGGVCTPAQWLKMDELSRAYANGTLRLTTRQTFQLHGLLKWRLKQTIQGMHQELMDSIAACGDVNRNVLACNNPHASTHHAEAYDLARRISEYLLPKTRAYHEIWLDAEKVAGTPEHEPIYGPTYLPRKFKTVVAVPPYNDVDIFAHDLGYIAIIEGGKIVGYNVTVGGGMGMTHGSTPTHPRLADMLGFCTPEQAIAVAEHVVTVQRDHGDRTDRKMARLKYTIEKHGIDWFRQQVEARAGFKLGAARPYTFTTMGDQLGWVTGHDGKSHLTLFIANGRVKDTPEYPLMTGLRRIAEVHQGEFRLTANQNLIIANVSPAERAKIEALVAEFGLDRGNQARGLRRNSMACVALPTCGLALAESERYLPDLVTEIEEVMAECGLAEEDVVIRMTGCPNGCARPYMAEIGLVGKAPGKYNLYLGAAFNGTRLSRLYKASVPAEQIAAELKPHFLRFAQERQAGEHFGDFCQRVGIVKPYVAGEDYHAPMV